MKFRPWMLILLFMCVMFWMLAQEAKAETEVELGPTNLSGDWAGGSIMISENAGKWSFGGGYVSEQFVKTCPRVDCENDIEPNIFFQVQRVVKYNHWQMGIGPAYFNNTNRALGTNLTWGLMLGYKWDKWAIRFRHYSNAGSGKPNMGQDMLTIGYTF